MQQRVMERELSELKDKLMATNRSLGLASSNIASQEATISTLRSKPKSPPRFRNPDYIYPYVCVIRRRSEGSRREVSKNADGHATLFGIAGRVLDVGGRVRAIHRERRQGSCKEAGQRVEQQNHGKCTYER